MISYLSKQIMSAEQSLIMLQFVVDDSFTLEMHIDTDEANAAKIATGNTVTIIK